MAATLPEHSPTHRVRKPSVQGNDLEQTKGEVARHVAEAMTTQCRMRVWPSHLARAATFLLLGVALSACGRMVHIATQLQNPDLVQPDDGFTATFKVGTRVIEISIENTSSEPIEVIWQKSSIVDTNGDSWDVMRSGGRGAWAARDFTGEDITRIPPHSTMKEWVAPRDKVTLDGNWSIRPYIPVECGPARCTGYKELVGKTVRLNMTLRLHGQDRDFDWRFLITRAVDSVRGVRPKDPDFSTEVIPVRNPSRP